MTKEVRSTNSEFRSENSSFELRTSNFELLCAIVLAELAITILIFYAFTRYFA
jgi:hypothetical protein